MRLPESAKVREFAVAGVLADIAHELSSIQGWEDRVNNTLSLLCDMYPASDVTLGARVEGWKTFYCEEPSDLPAVQSVLLHHYSILTGETPPVFIDSRRMGRGELTPIEGTVAQARSFITMPVVGADHTLGVLHVSTDDPDAYSLQDVSIISIVASQIGAFLRNVLAYMTEVRNRREIEHLKATAEQHLDTLQTITRNIPDIIARFDREFRHIYISPSVKQVTGMPPEAFIGKTNVELGMPGHLVEMWHKCLGEAFRTGERQSLEFEYEGVSGARFFDSVMVPEFGPAGDVTSVLTVSRDITGRKMAENELTRTREVLENQLVQLQRALVPAEPSIVEGYSLASLYIPGMKGQEIGGDFFDVFETEENKVGILIGDVAGKGIEAASLAAAARSTVRAFTYESSSPSEALIHSNTVLTSEQMGITQFVTMSLIVLDPASGDLRYASGGHPPAVLYHTDGSTELLSRRNMPIGVFQGEEYTEGSAHLAPGDKLVLFTDGITEARRRNDMLGAQGVACVVQTHGTEDPQTLIESILSAASEWSQNRLNDDIAIIAVERQH